MLLRGDGGVGKQTQLEGIRGENGGQMENVVDVDMNEGFWDVQLAIIAQHRIADVDKVWGGMVAEHMNSVSNGVQTAGSSDITSEQVRNGLQQVVFFHAIEDFEELMSVESNSGGAMLVAGVVGEHAGIEDVDIVTEQLQGEDSGPVSDITGGDVALDGQYSARAFIGHVCGMGGGGGIDGRAMEEGDAGEAADGEAAGDALRWARTHPGPDCGGGQEGYPGG